MRHHIEPRVMARVQALLDARQNLPRAKAEDRPKVQVVTGLEAKAEDGGGTYTDLLIYDEISWFGITAQDVADALDGITGDLNVRVNSPGGDVFDGVAIFNMLSAHDGAVTVTVDGLAASAASFIAMAGDRITMNRGSQMMIHEASGLCIGNAADMTEMAGTLDRVSQIIAGIYADRTGIAADSWRTQMQAETWFTGDEAVSAGLADSVAPPRGRRAAAGGAENRWDLSVFQYAGRVAAPAPPPPLDVASEDDVAPQNQGPDITAISTALEALKGDRQ